MLEQMTQGVEETRDSTESILTGIKLPLNFIFSSTELFFQMTCFSLLGDQRLKVGVCSWNVRICFLHTLRELPREEGQFLLWAVPASSKAGCSPSSGSWPSVQGPSIISLLLAPTAWHLLCFLKGSWSWVSPCLALSVPHLHAEFIHW